LRQASHSAALNAPRPLAAERKAKAPCARLQHASRKQRNHDIEIRAEEQHQAHHEDQEPQRGCSPDVEYTVAQALPGVLSFAYGPLLMRLGVQLSAAHQRQPDQHRDEAEPIEQKEQGDGAGAHNDAPEAGPQDARQVTQRGV
jgi:hypothetical protein